MMSGIHRYPRQEEVVYGRPATEALIEMASALHVERILVTSTSSLSGTEGWARKIADALGNRCVGVFSGITAHSPREGVVEGARQARRLGCDLLVAVGGGSVIDATKVIQLCLWAGIEQARELDRYRAGAGADRVDSAQIRPTVRMVAVPTTLSAAEFTPFAGVTDSQRRIKEGFTHPYLAPRNVVLDPAVTLQTPAQLWFSTGIKAVDHAVEQLCNPRRAPFADTLAAEGLRYLSHALPATRSDPAELGARLQCQFGMWFAISGATSGHGMGASHAIGHTLGGMFGVPHGLTSCITLPAVLRWNEAVDAARQPVGPRPFRVAGSVPVRSGQEPLHLVGPPDDTGQRGHRSRSISRHRRAHDERPRDSLQRSPCPRPKRYRRNPGARVSQRAGGFPLTSPLPS